MSYNILKNAKSIKNSDLCRYDSLSKIKFEFLVDADFNGFDVYNNVCLYGVQNGILFGTATGRECYISRQDYFSFVDAEFYYVLKIMMKVTDNNESKTIPSLTEGRIQWVSYEDGVWDSYKQQDFDIIPDDKWHLYVIELGPNQYWKGHINNLRVYPFIDAFTNDNFYIKYIETSSEDRWNCLNTQCSHYSKYEHPCPWIGKKASRVAGVSKELYTVSGTSNELVVNIDGYGNEIFNFGEYENIKGNDIVQLLSNKLSNLNIGGYVYSEVEYDDQNNKLLIRSGSVGSDSSVSILDSQLARELGFYDDNGNDVSNYEAGEAPATGYESKSSRLLTNLEINKLFDDSVDSIAYKHEPNLYSVEGGRSDYYIVGTGNMLSDFFSGSEYQSHVVVKGRTIIDLSHPFNSNGKIKCIYIGGSVESIDQAKVYIIRPYKNGYFKVIHSLNIPKKDTTQYTRNPTSYRVDCDVMVRRGDLLGVYNINLNLGNIQNGKPDATFYFIEGEISGTFRPTSIFSYGTAGFAIYARSDRLQHDLSLDIDFGKRINIEDIYLYGTKTDSSSEFNISSCLDVNWVANLYGGTHSHKLLGGSLVHRNVAYGLDALNDGVVTPDNGIVGTYWSRDLDSGLCTYGEHSYFYVNGDDEFVNPDDDASELGQASMTDNSGLYERCPATEFEDDPFSLVLLFPYGIKVSIFKSIMYFKERDNFRQFELSYKLCTGSDGNSVISGRFNKIPVYTSIFADRCDCSDNAYLLANPTNEEPHFYIDDDGNEVCTNWAEIRDYGSTDWLVLEHQFDEIECCGFGIYCNKHHSTKIVELEVYSKFSNNASLSDSVEILFSKYEDIWKTVGFEDTTQDVVVASVGDAPRYFTLNISSDVNLVINEIKIETGDQIKLYDDCSDILLLEDSRSGVVNKSYPMVIKNDYDRPLNLYVDIHKNINYIDSVIFWNLLSSDDSIENSEIGPGCYYYKRDDGFEISNRSGQCAINVPCYGLKNLIHDKKAYYTVNDFCGMWNEYGTLSSGVNINFGSRANYYKVNLNFPLTSSKYWKVSSYDGSASGYVDYINACYGDSSVDISYVYVQANDVNSSKIKTTINSYDGSINEPEIFSDDFRDGVFDDKWTFYSSNSENELIECGGGLDVKFLKKSDNYRYCSKRGIIQTSQKRCNRFLGFSPYYEMDYADGVYRLFSKELEYKYYSYMYIEKEFDNPFISFELEIDKDPTNTYWKDYLDTDEYECRLVFFNDNNEPVLVIVMDHGIGPIYDVTHNICSKRNILKNNDPPFIETSGNCCYGQCVNFTLRKIYDDIFYSTVSENNCVNNYVCSGRTTDFISKIRLVWFNRYIYHDIVGNEDDYYSGNYIISNKINNISIKALPVISVDESICLEFSVNEELTDIELYTKNQNYMAVYTSLDNENYNLLAKNFDTYTGDLTDGSKSKAFPYKDFSNYGSLDWVRNYSGSYGYSGSGRPYYAFDDFDGFESYRNSITYGSNYVFRVNNEYYDPYSKEHVITTYRSDDRLCENTDNYLFLMGFSSLLHWFGMCYDHNPVLTYAPFLFYKYICDYPWIGIDFGVNKRKIKKINLSFINYSENEYKAIYGDDFSSSSISNYVEVQASNDEFVTVSGNLFGLDTDNLHATYIPDPEEYSMGRILPCTSGIDSGKWYWEVYVNEGSPYIGIGSSDVKLNTTLGDFSMANNYSYSSFGQKLYNGNVRNFTSSNKYFSSGSTIGVALDLDNNMVWFSNDGEWLDCVITPEGMGTPAFNINEDIYYPMVYFNKPDDEVTMRFDFDDFSYVPPSGFCSVSGCSFDANYISEVLMEYCDWFEVKTWDTLKTTSSLNPSEVGYETYGGVSTYVSYDNVVNSITFDNDTYYRYYRLYFPSSSTIKVIVEVEMFEDWSDVSSSSLSVSNNAYYKKFAIDLENVHTLYNIRNYGEDANEIVLEGTSVVFNSLLDIGLNKESVTLSTTDTSNINDVVWNEPDYIVDNFDDDIIVDNWEVGGRENSVLIESGGKIYVDDYGDSLSPSHGPNMTYILSNQAYSFNFVIDFNMFVNTEQAGLYIVECLDDSDSAFIKITIYKEADSLSSSDVLYVKVEGELSQKSSSSGNALLSFSNYISVTKTFDDIVSYRMNNVDICSCGVDSGLYLSKVKISYERYYSDPVPSDHSTNSFSLTTYLDEYSTNARWVRINVPVGGSYNYTGAYIYKLGIYPDISVSVAPGGGYNCYWENLGTNLTNNSDLYWVDYRRDTGSKFGDDFCSTVYTGNNYNLVVPLYTTYVNQSQFADDEPLDLGMNLAYKADVSSNTYHREYYPSNVVNGDTTGFDGKIWGFDHVGGENPYIDIDLGDIFTIGSVKIYHGRFNNDDNYLNSSKKYDLVYHDNESYELENEDSFDDDHFLGFDDYEYCLYEGINIRTPGLYAIHFNFMMKFKDFKLVRYDGEVVKEFVYNTEYYSSNPHSGEFWILPMSIGKYYRENILINFIEFSENELGLYKFIIPGRSCGSYFVWWDEDIPFSFSNFFVAKFNDNEAMTIGCKRNEIRTSPYYVSISTTSSGNDFEYASLIEKCSVDHDILTTYYKYGTFEYYGGSGTGTIQVTTASGVSLNCGVLQSGDQYERTYYLNPVDARRVRITFTEWESLPYWYYNQISSKYEIFSGSFVREIEVYRHDSKVYKKITNEDWPIVAVDLKSKFKIASIVLLINGGYKHVGLTNVVVYPNTWWYSFYWYSDDLHEVPEKISFYESSDSEEIVYYSSNGSGVRESGYMYDIEDQEENYLEYIFDDNVYMSSGNYLVNWEAYYPTSSDKISLCFEGYDTVCCFLNNVEEYEDWYCQYSSLHLNESGYYKIAGKQRAVFSEDWGIRNVKVTRITDSEKRWFVIECNSATNYRDEKLEERSSTGEQFLDTINVIGAEGLYSPIKYSWWWDSKVSTLDNDYFNVKEEECSLRINYPNTYALDVVYFINRADFGHDWLWSINDLLCFWLYIDDVNKLDLDNINVVFGTTKKLLRTVVVSNYVSASDQDAEVEQDREEIIVDDPYYYNWGLDGNSLCNGWNRIRLKFKEYTDICPFNENSFFGVSTDLDSMLNLATNGRNLESFALYYKGKGESFTLNITDIKIERNVFDDYVKFGNGLCLDEGEMLNIPLSNLDLKKGTIEFWVKLYCDVYGRDYFGDVDSRTFFTVVSNANEILSFGIKSGTYFQFAFGKIVEGLFESDVFVDYGAKSAFAIDDIIHIAVVWSNDGKCMDNNDTIRVYINNEYAFSTTDVWDVSDSRFVNVKFGGGLTEKAFFGKPPKGSAIFHNIKIYNYCKTDFDIINNDIDSQELSYVPNDFIEISKDDVNFYGVESDNIPLMFEQVPSKETKTVYVRSNKVNGFSKCIKKTANLDIEWQVIV